MLHRRNERLPRWEPPISEAELRRAPKLIAALIGLVMLAVALGQLGCGGDAPTVVDPDPDPIVVYDSVEAWFVDEADGVAPDTVWGHGLWVNYDSVAAEYDMLHWSIEYRDNTYPEWYLYDVGFYYGSEAGFGGTYTPGGPEYWFSLRWTVWTDTRERNDTVFVGASAQLIWEPPTIGGANAEVAAQTVPTFRLLAPR